MQTEIGDRYIDLETIFRSKSPKTANAIPGFMFRYLRRIVHEKEINQFLYKNRTLFDLDFVDAVIRRFSIETEAIGLSEELLSGRPLVAANHPLGGIDGISLMHVTGKLRPDIIAPGNDLLLNLPNMRNLFFGVNKHGSNAGSIQALDEVFASNRVILFFPAGLVSRRQPGGISDLDWKPTFIKKAVKHQRDIIPVHISGRNSNFFYTLAQWRGRLGIKANIEMLFLSDEVFKLRDKHIVMRFGRIIPWQTFDRRHKAHQWSALLRDHVYKLANSEDPSSIPFNY